MEEQSTTRLGTTIHAYTVTASLPSPTAFRCYAPYASLFADGPLPVVADSRATRWRGNFEGPLHGEHVRDTMARAAGVHRQPVVRLGVHKASSRDVLLCPHAGERFKEWPESRWSALAEALVAEGFSVRACPEPGRDPMAWPRAVVVETVGLETLARRISEARVIVGPDSGHLHLADLLGTPVVGLYAATSSLTYGPYGDRQYCVDRHRDAFPDGRPYNSSVHLHGTPMQAITVPAVLAKIRDAVKNFSLPP
jgi:hypothetical protein